MLERWKLDILDAEVRDMDELVAWLDKGAGLEAACPIRRSQMANTLYGYGGYAIDRERRLMSEGSSQQVRAAALQRKAQAQRRALAD